MFLPCIPSLATILLSNFAPAEAHPSHKRRGVLSEGPLPKVIVRPVHPFQAPSSLSVASNILPLQTLNQSEVSPNRRFTPSGNAGSSTTLLSLFESSAFSSLITVDGQTFQVLVDTGSSDLWLVSDPYICVDIQSNAPIAQDDCSFGPAYKSSGKYPSYIRNQNFRIKYGSGESVQGALGIENVGIAGMNVYQEMGLVNHSAWSGDGVTSGLMGLAYSSLTSAYRGNNASQDGLSPATGQVPYSPLFRTLYTSKGISPVFSLALERQMSGPAGYLAFGGLPPVTVTGQWTNTSILITTVQGYPQTYDFYTIQVDHVRVGNLHLRGNRYVVDSGTTLSYLPSDLAQLIASRYSPPAVYSPSEGVFYVYCNARSPMVSFTIGGLDITINPLDMLLYAGQDQFGDDICISGINAAGNDPNRDLFILGCSFLKGVVAVFDVGAGQMSFASREYNNNDPY